MTFLAPSSAPVRRQRADGVEAVSLEARRPLWLIGADICVFTRLDFTNVAEKHRPRAIAQRARQLAPFAEPGWHAADLDGNVALWFWDAARARATLSEEPAPASTWQILPEQLFFEDRPDVCLRRLPDTEILERWQAGSLVYSARLPADEHERGLLLRSAGLAIDSIPPQLLPTLTAKRWDVLPLDWRKLGREPVAAGLAAVVAASLWLAWSVGELAGWQLANHRLAAQIQEQQATLAPVLGQREEALALVARNQAFAELFGDITALEAAAEFEHLVGARYDRILSWQYTDRTIRITLQDDAPDNRAYVEALQRSPWFERVSVSPALRPDQLNLEITLALRGSATPEYLQAKAPKGAA